MGSIFTFPKLGGLDRNIYAALFSYLSGFVTIDTLNLYRISRPVSFYIPPVPRYNSVIRIGAIREPRCNPMHQSVAKEAVNNVTNLHLRTIAKKLSQKR